MKIIFDKTPERYQFEAQEHNNRVSIEGPNLARYSEEIMTELRLEFERLNLNPGYHISAIGQPDASGWSGGLCLHEEDGHWLIYHSERGNRSRPEIFSNIQNAANYFLWVHAAKPQGNNSDVGMLPRCRIQDDRRDV